MTSSASMMCWSGSPLALQTTEAGSHTGLCSCSGTAQKQTTWKAWMVFLNPVLIRFLTGVSLLVMQRSWYLHMKRCAGGATHKRLADGAVMPLLWLFVNMTKIVNSALEKNNPPYLKYNPGEMTHADSALHRPFCVCLINRFRPKKTRTRTKHNSCDLAETSGSPCFNLSPLNDAHGRHQTKPKGTFKIKLILCLKKRQYAIMYLFT